MLESLFIKLAGQGNVFKVCYFIKKRLQNRCFSLNIAKILRAPILKNICKRLLVTQEVKYPPYVCPLKDGLRDFFWNFCLKLGCYLFYKVMELGFFGLMISKWTQIKVFRVYEKSTQVVFLIFLHEVTAIWCLTVDLIGFYGEKSWSDVFGQKETWNGAKMRFFRYHQKSVRGAFLIFAWICSDIKTWN